MAIQDVLPCWKQTGINNLFYRFNIKLFGITYTANRRLRVILNDSEAPVKPVQFKLYKNSYGTHCYGAYSGRRRWWGLWFSRDPSNSSKIMNHVPYAIVSAARACYVSMHRRERSKTPVPEVTVRKTHFWMFNHAPGDLGGIFFGSIITLTAVSETSLKAESLISML